MDALFHEASKLPKIEIKKPARIIGTNTIHALQSGIYYGCASQVDGIVRYMIKETNSNPSVIATGRMAHLVSQVSETIQKVDPYLTLKGLYYIYTKMLFRLFKILTILINSLLFFSLNFLVY